MSRLSVTLGAACPECQAKQNEDPAILRVNAIFQFDPTRTTTLRQAFTRAMDRRFNALKTDIRISIIQRDCFGLQPQIAALAPAGVRAFDFPRTSTKVTEFMKWLEEQERIGILEISQRPGGLRHGIEEAWTDTYIHSAYARGVTRGRSELRGAGYDVRSVGDTPGGIDNIMAQSFHADRVGVMYTRTFDELQSVTQFMNGRIRRSITEGLTIGLAQGIAEGKSPVIIARELYKDVAHHVDKIGKVRARMIARTEVIRAHHLATIQEYRQADAEMGVGVKAEWSTAGFNVCPICIDLENGGPYDLNKAEGMLPAHPNCVTGETIILAPDKISGFVATYTGPIIEIVFASGRNLSVTPNHMLLTPYGFAFAKSLNKGNNVLGCPQFDRLTSLIDPNDDGNPARIDNIVKALAESRGMATDSVPATTKDFHGDGEYCEGDIDIIGANSLLWNGSNAIIRQQQKQLAFEFGGEFFLLFGFGSLTEFFKAAAFAADGSMGRFRESLAASNTLAFHADKTRLTGGTELDTRITNDAVQRRSRTIESLCECLDRYTGFVETDEIVDINTVSVESTHVYDLQSLSTIYIANGILSSNCRCVVLPVVLEKAQRARR